VVHILLDKNIIVLFQLPLATNFPEVAEGLYDSIVQADGEDQSESNIIAIASAYRRVEENCNASTPVGSTGFESL
jgi:hypothetical protein